MRPARARRGLALLVLLAACAKDEAPVAVDTGVEATDEVLLAREVAFTGAVDGVAEGFDLDGVVTAAGEGTGCGQTDLVGPDGTPGIDNAFAGLLDLIVAIGGQALPDLVQNAVLSGELLLLFEVGPEQADGCRTVDVARGAGVPAIGTDGVILTGQTFDVDAAQPSAHVACAREGADGALSGGGLELRLPLHVFDETIDMTLTDGTVRLVPGEGDTWSVLVGGGVSVAEIRANVLGFDALPESLVGGITSALDLRADLDGPEGPCTRMSLALAMEAVPAFVFPPLDTDVADP